MHSVPERRISLVLSLLIVAGVLSGCRNDRSYDVRGRVVGFGSDARTVIVEHEEIEGLMPAMTMPFSALDTAEVSVLGEGDAIEFRLLVSRDSSWIDGIRRLPDDAIAEHPAGSVDPHYNQPDRPPLLEPGGFVPTVTLVTHADSTLEMSELQGKAVIITFLYTACPLPEFCPLMARNLAQIQPQVREEYGSKVHLLAVSFDPENDTPEVLRSYAGRYTSDLSNWTFATGDSTEIRDFANRFGVYYRPGEGEIMHNLTTAVITPEGRVHRLWRGNRWKPDEVLESLRQLRLNDG